MDLVDPGLEEPFAAFGGHVGGHVLEVLLQQVTQEFLLIGAHLGGGQTLGGSAIGLGHVGPPQIIGGGLIDQGQLELFRGGQLDELAGEIFFGPEDANRALRAGFDQRGIRAVELGGAADDFPLVEGEVEREVVPFEAPAPASLRAGSAEQAEVVLTRVATFAPFSPLAPLEKIQHLFEAHDGEGLIVARFREAARDELLGGGQGGAFQVAEGKPLPLAGDEVPVEPLGIFKSELQPRLLRFGQGLEKGVGRLLHPLGGGELLLGLTPQHGHHGHQHAAGSGQLRDKTRHEGWHSHGKGTGSRDREDQPSDQAPIQ